MNKKYHNTILLATCLLFGAYLRFHHLGLRPLWLDEANSVNFLKYPVNVLWEKMAGAESAPAYVYAIKFWSFAFGDSEMAARSFSAILALISIIAIYFLGKVLFGRKAGLWAAFLMSVNFFSIFYSVQARQYTAVILVSILCSYFFWQALSRKRASDNVLFILFSLLGVYLHYWFFFLFGVQALFLVLIHKKKLLAWAGKYLIVALAALPWMLVLYEYSQKGINDWITTPGIGALAETFRDFIYGSGWVMILISLIAFLNAFFGVKQTEIDGNSVMRLVEKKIDIKKDQLAIYFVALMLLVPLVVAWLISQFFPVYVVGRYEAVVLPFFILIIAYLWLHIKSPAFTIIAVAIVAFFSFQQVLADKNTILSYKYNEKKIAEHLVGNINPGDAIIYTGLSRPTFDYYLPRISASSGTTEKYSFPAELENHPAAQSVRLMMKDEGKLINEARDLSGKLSGRGIETVWIIHAMNNPVSDILSESIGAEYNCESELDLTLPENQPVVPLHFQQILRCSKK